MDGRHGDAESLSTLRTVLQRYGHGGKIGSRLAGVGSPFMPAKGPASPVNPPQREPDGSRRLGARPPCAELRWRGGADHMGSRRSEYRDAREADGWAPHVSQRRARVL